jgi:hypothetical protein
MKTETFILETSAHKFTATVTDDEVAITCEPPIDVLALTNAETCDLFHWTETEVAARHYKNPRNVKMTIPPALGEWLYGHNRPWLKEWDRRKQQDEA